MQLARGDRVAFLTQDATPAGDGWLAALIAGFAEADDVAAVFGPHVPRPDASHMIKAEMERHFAVWGDDGTTSSASTARPPAWPPTAASPAAGRSSPTSTAWSPSAPGSRSPTATSPTPRTSCSAAS